MAELTVGCTFSDRIEALLDGRVTIAGHTPAISIVEPQRLFRQVLRETKWDVAELSMGSHIAAVAAGRRDYVGVPVFLSRSFRHSNLYVRSDRRIERPEDLAGKAIGLVDFQQTAALWLRGLLADEHGVARESIDWVTGGLHAPVLEDRAKMTLPAGIRVRRSAATLNDLLAAGEIDAVISPTAPRCFTAQTSPVVRLWPDYRERERAFWHRTGLFPIMHVLVVRRSLVEADPGLPEALYAAFEEARRLAAADLLSRDFPKSTLPWLMDHAHAVRDTLGGDPWTYGLAQNHGMLVAMLRYAEADGLTGLRLEPRDLFV